MKLIDRALAATPAASCAIAVAGAPPARSARFPAGQHCRPRTDHHCLCRRNGGGGRPAPAGTGQAHHETLGRSLVRYEYPVRLGTSGSFHLPPVRVAARYTPEMFALLPDQPLVSSPAR